MYIFWLIEKHHFLRNLREDSNVFINHLIENKNIAMF